ncbi:DUF1761 domain-containing protein [Rhodococcus triatomae]|uniref:DUF1761 domain-containing protein n=2 Tax=Rhodococcus triatomae TaxID=300028 RepID=A0A1G8FMS8_9NOCA|nr:DUF1761 domain-containing protein [Rhodococcus triatomae]QNG24558.1 DUF1761 domain-containing protein [Rhodococcus triatomae]SDH83445.1 Protein of unknown function [Rhodococcus triatomae]
MEMSISWLAVVVATVVGMAIAGVWYGWALVGVWRELTGVTEEDSKKAGKRPFAVLLVSIFVTAVVLAAACSVAAGFFDRDSLWLDLAVGLAAWLGFSLTTLVQHNAFEQKPTRLTVINTAYQLVLFLGMALAVGLLR